MEELTLLTDIKLEILNPQALFLEPLRLNIKLKVATTLTEPLQWRVCYMDGISEEQDLLTFSLDPCEPSKRRFTLEIPPPDPLKIDLDGMLTSSVYQLVMVYNGSEVWRHSIFLTFRDNAGIYKPPGDDEISGDEIASKDTPNGSHLDEEVEEDSTEEEGEEVEEGETETEIEDDDEMSQKEPVRKHVVRMASPDIVKTFSRDAVSMGSPKSTAILTRMASKLDE
ncbi:ASF1-like histone chaperone [Giardia muris]|uniref:ASF1-like histone chaperone n=1 Tax=Giardia muris TaxID=5742 RepID=A0A4Z1SQM8_GIAMU|nr:ASF1-like histone chaperone [Giardia muris]|eukprot:TNJ28164.1 ASF1-like histone chaperone [Giardia muris]